jgi:hypothetical protein
MAGKRLTFGEEGAQLLQGREHELFPWQVHHRLIGSLLLGLILLSLSLSFIVGTDQ